MDYEQAWKELHRFIDRGIARYKEEHSFGKDVRFYSWVAFRMKMHDLEKQIKGEEDASGLNQSTDKAPYSC